MGDLRFRDYLEIATRRKWWIVLTTIAVFVVTVVVAIRTPNVYRSETVILVDPQKVSESVVSSPVTTSVMDRLSTVRQLVNSPTHLRELIREMGLFPYINGPRDEDKLVQTMVKSITIEVADAGGQRLSAFKIAYQGPDPVETAKVANALATMVIRENLAAREQQFSGTEDFLETELQDTKKQLEQKEIEVQRIKTQYIMDLPESKQYHLEALATLRNQLRSSQDRVAQAQQQKVYLQSLAAAAPVVDVDAGANSGGGSGIEAQIEKLETRLADLRSHYGPNFPDVRKTQAELDAAKAKAAEEEKKGQSGTAIVEPPKPTHRPSRNPVVEAEIAQLDQEIEDQTKQQSQLNEQIDFHAGKLERVPLFEEQLADMMRDYDTLRNHYNILLDKKLSAEMASQLESRQKGERFVILDTAPIPTQPFGPKRGLFAAAGLFGGLLGGIGLAMLVEMMDESVRTEREAEQILGGTVLVGVPRVLSPAHIQWNRLRMVGAVTGTTLASAGIGFILSYVGKWIV